MLTAWIRKIYNKTLITWNNGILYMYTYNIYNYIILFKGSDISFIKTLSKLAEKIVLFTGPKYITQS